jgi:hypothetical protein
VESKRNKTPFPGDTPLSEAVYVVVEKFIKDESES